LPLLRNCYVYFEMSVGELEGSTNNKKQMASLSVGISTLDMPLNTLVGSWKGEQ